MHQRRESLTTSKHEIRSVVIKSKLSDSGIRYSSRTDYRRHHQLEQEITVLKEILGSTFTARNLLVLKIDRGEGRHFDDYLYGECWEVDKPHKNWLSTLMRRWSRGNDVLKGMREYLSSDN